MPAYEVKINDLGGQTLKNGHNVMTVFAEDGPDAIACASGQNDADGSWASATATEIVVGTDLSPVTDAQGKTRSFTLKVAVTDNAAGTTASFSTTAGSTDSYANVFDAMVVLLLAHGDFTGAAFGGNLLTLSDIGDGLGDSTVKITFEYGGEAIPSFLSTITHEGIAGAVLTIATNASVEIPEVVGSYSS